MSPSSDQNADSQTPKTGFESEVDFASAAAKLSSDQKQGLWNFIGERREMLREDMCLYPIGECAGAICNSHSIQESKLADIARAGHVYGFEFDLGKIVKKSTFDAFAKVGINSASVFRGFCSHHDAELFRPIDTQDFKCSPEQLFLYFYRAICRELHIRHCMAKAHATPDDIARVHPGIPKHHYEESVRWQRTHFLVEALKLYQCKFKMDSALLNAEFRRLKHYIITFKRQPSVLSAAAFTPTCDFAGRGFRLVSHPLLSYHVMTITTLPTLSGGVVILSWFDNGPMEFELFCHSLSRVSADKLTSSVIRLLFEFCENIAIAPHWWDAVPGDCKNALMNRARSGIPPNRRTESCLTEDDLYYDDWEVEMRFRL